MHGPTIYQEDLAYIHIEGYGFHWERAAETVLKHLQQCGVHGGTVVDLGCGGGQWLARLSSEGFEVCGVDVSASMIRAARKRVPNARFITGSFAEVELPRCDAVTSLGEPINYLDGKKSIQKTLRRVFQALRPGGVFVFDAREPSSEPVEPRMASRVGADWACFALIEEPPKSNLIVRHITSFRHVGKTYRRGEEVHRLHVYPKAEMLHWLRTIGFRVRSFRGYGDDYRFTQHQCVYVARKP